MLVVSLGCYLLSAIGLILLFVWFTPAGEHCQFNSAIIFFTCVLIASFTATSLSDRARLSVCFLMPLVVRRRAC